MIYYTEKVVILMYHNIDNTKFSDITITPERFKDDLCMLKESGFNIISLEDVIKACNGKCKLPPNAVSITFDDGLYGVYEYAVKELKKYRMPSTCFIITSRVNDYISENNLRFINKSMIKDMYNNYNIDIQSHTHKSHELNLNNRFIKKGVLASRIYNKNNIKENISEYYLRVKKDLELSSKIIYECVNKKSTILSFPFGHYNDLVIKAATECGFEYFVTCKEGGNIQQSNNKMLKRINAGVSYISAAKLKKYIIGMATNEYITKVRNKSLLINRKLKKLV